MPISITNIPMISRGKLKSFSIIRIKFKCTYNTSIHTHIFIFTFLPKYLSVFPNMKPR